LSELCGLLWRCRAQFPSYEGRLLADMDIDLGSWTYASAARAIKPWLAREDPGHPHGDTIAHIHASTLDNQNLSSGSRRALRSRASWLRDLHAHNPLEQLSTLSGSSGKLLEISGVSSYLRGHGDVRRSPVMTLRVRTVSDEEREALGRMARSRNLGAGLVRRARIVVHALEGSKAPEIGAQLERFAR
jgi:hypothetical protein